MPDDKHVENAKKIAAENREARTKAFEHHQATVGASKPTPTQEENDLAMLGSPPKQLEDDGSGPDPHVAKNLESQGSKGSYQTRQATASRSGAAAPHTGSHPRNE